MKNLTTEQIIKNYADYSMMQGEYMLESDYKQNNKTVKKLNDLYLLLKNDVDLANTVYKELISEATIKLTPNAAANAACDCLRLNIYIDEALKVLSVMSKRNNILGFGSEMALKTWREKGKLDE